MQLETAIIDLTFSNPPLFTTLVSVGFLIINFKILDIIYIFFYILLIIKFFISEEKKISFKEMNIFTQKDRMIKVRTDTLPPLSHCIKPVLLHK